MFNDRSSLLAHLATRRSGKARDMVTPGPDADELARILALAARVPDHGKLFPWRYITVPSVARDDFARLLTQTYVDEKPAAGRLEVEAMRAFAAHAPTLVVVVASPRVPHKIPLWEQQLSVGALCMNLIHAAHAHGYVANWLTGWPATSPGVAAGLGLADQECIAGYFFIGTAARPLEERPRPDMAAIVSEWAGPGQ